MGFQHLHRTIPQDCCAPLAECLSGVFLCVIFHFREHLLDVVQAQFLRSWHIELAQYMMPLRWEAIYLSAGRFNVADGFSPNIVR